MNQKQKKKILLIATMVLCVLLFCVKLTGVHLHALLGKVLVVLAFVHIIRNRKKIRRIPRKRRVVDLLMCASLVLIFVTGILVHPLHDVILIKISHSLFAILFVAACVVHAYQQNCFSRK